MPRKLSPPRGNKVAEITNTLWDLHRALREAQSHHAVAEKDVERAKREAKEARERLKALGVTPGTAKEVLDKLNEEIQSDLKKLNESLAYLQED